jgi:hypothetical protein
MSTNYMPKPTHVRPGSLDAFTKPSVISGKRVPHKAPHNGPVGVLKDRTQHHND